MDVSQGFQVAPGQCYVCGSSDQSLYRADLGEVYGVRRTRLYICEHCVTAMSKRIADLKGERWVSKDDAEALSAAAAEAGMWQDRAEAAEAKLAGFASALEGVV